MSSIGAHTIQLQPLAQTAALEFLVSHQNPDHGWGYLIGQGSTVEATAAAVVALDRVSGATAAAGNARQWLAETQHADGGWGLSRKDPESSWQTAWALLAFTQGESYATVPERAVRWLLNAEPLRVTEEVQQDTEDMMLGIDLSLYGWAWHPGEASWVEPTALALLVLDESMQPEAGARIEMGVRYLVDRRCQPGGWNVGSPFMLGASLAPRAVPTAWTLLALARHAPEAILADDTAALRQDMVYDGGALALAWGLIALRQMDLADAAAAARLQALQAPDGSWNQNPYHTALALLATAEPVRWPEKR